MWRLRRTGVPRVGASSRRRSVDVETAREVAGTARDDVGVLLTGGDAGSRLDWNAPREDAPVRCRPCAACSASTTIPPPPISATSAARRWTCGPARAATRWTAGRPRPAIGAARRSRRRPRGPPRPRSPSTLQAEPAPTAPASAAPLPQGTRTRARDVLAASGGSLGPDGVRSAALRGPAPRHSPARAAGGHRRRRRARGDGRDVPWGAAAALAAIGGDRRARAGRGPRGTPGGDGVEQRDGQRDGGRRGPHARIRPPVRAARGGATPAGAAERPDAAARATGDEPCAPAVAALGLCEAVRR